MTNLAVFNFNSNQVRIVGPVNDITLSGESKENKEISNESRKYLFLLSELGIDIKIEQDPNFKNKWKIGKRHLYKDQLEEKLRNVYELATHCRQLVQQISYQAHRLDFDVDFKKWENLDSGTRNNP
jgi:hypothetical protein